MKSVSALVESVVAASAQAVPAHFASTLDRYGSLGRRPDEVLAALAAGFEGDLEDSQVTLEGVGFDHLATSEVFRRHLRALRRDSERWVQDTGLYSGPRKKWGPGSTLDRHIWGQDYERGLSALLHDAEGHREPSDFSEDAPDDFGQHFEIKGRTRASALTQRCLLQSRRALDPTRSLRSARSQKTARVPVPSPLWIAAELLTDPDYPASEAYASAALRVLIYKHVEAQFGRRPDLSYEALTSAYRTLENRERVSRPRFIRDPETAYICHYLAMRGYLSLYMPIDALTNAKTFDPSAQSGGFFSQKTRFAFRLNSVFSSLPNVADVITQLTGLPLPIEGAEALFRGGLRLSKRGDLVGAVSGTFGAGKTSFCLGLAAALAPIGCRTLFLTSEEDPEDLVARLEEATPENILRSTPLFSNVRLRGTEPRRFPWFFADRLKVAHDGEQSTSGDLVAGLKNLLVQILGQEDALASDAVGLESPLLVVVDGFHALFSRSPAEKDSYEGALAELIDFCRSKKAIFLFTSGEEDKQVLRLEYLCDLVVSLDRLGFDSLDAQPARVLKLLKTRRQAVRPGAHIFHLTAPRGLRIKPSLSSVADSARLRSWSRADPRRALLIRPRDRADMVPSRRPGRRFELVFRELSQVLIRGLGSSGKSGLALSILHRRPTFSRYNRRDARSIFFSDRGLSEDSAPRIYESRVLIISFLYQEDYYGKLIPKLYASQGSSDPHEEVEDAEESLFPTGFERVLDIEEPRRLRADFLKQEAISLYPGGLVPEDLIAKVVRRLRSAELRGIPFTGVLVDGIHNVFLQFPAIEANPSFWPQLFSLLRRQSVTVMTTHTDFQIGRSDAGNEAAMVDARAAQAKAAPLLSVLVSAADYVLDVLPISRSLSDELQLSSRSYFEVITRESLEGPAYASRTFWDRLGCSWYSIARRPSPK